MYRKPIILMDQDGPLAKFDDNFYRLCEEAGYTMHNGEVNLANRCVIHRFAVDCIDDKEHRVASRAIVESQGWFEQLEPTEGCVEGMEALAEVADVWICTKPLESNLWCRDEKAAWVRKHLGKQWERKLILAPNKSMVRGDLLVDDAVKLEWIDVAEWKPVVFPLSWNGEGSKWEGFPRWCWDDPIDKLLELI